MGPYLLCPGSPQYLHAATTTGNGGIFYPKGAVARVTVVWQGTGTTSGGAAVIEESYYDINDLNNPTAAYGGTWSPIQTLAASDVTGGQQQVIHIAGSIYALRVRITSNITGGGSVNVIVWGN